MKFSLILFICLVIVAPTFAQEATEETSDKWQCPGEFSGQTLNVHNWSTYIADNTIADFEEACDVDVTYTLFDSDVEVLEILQQGNQPRYDIVIPGGVILSDLIAAELVQPLDQEMIPNAVNLSDELLDPPFDPENVYSYPYQWGTLAVGYNTNVFPDGITSWEQVWDYDGLRAWINDSAVMGIALLWLGYDPNTTSVNEILEARNFLGSSGDDNLRIVSDSIGQDLLANEDVDLVIEYSGDIIDLTYECECEDFAYSIPDEGANIWIDNMAVPMGAQNPELANVFIDYILDPQVNADISNYTAYSSPNQVAIDDELIDAELLENRGIYPNDSVREGLFFSSNLGEDLNDVYRNNWEELIFFYGDE